MKPLLIQIIPAQPGYFTVIDLDEIVELGDQVIAWRIETHEVKDSDCVFSTCTAITVDGDVVSNCIGVQNPDKTVTVFENQTYSSLDALQADKKRKKV